LYPSSIHFARQSSGKNTQGNKLTSIASGIASKIESTISKVEILITKTKLDMLPKKGDW